MVEDFDVFYSEDFFFLSIPLRVLKQGIGSFIYLSLMIIDLDVVTRKFLSPADLSGALILCIHKLSKVVMVDKYENFMLRAL